MSTTTQSSSQPFHFNREQLLAIAEEKHQAYASARPFPHIYFDDFLPPAVLEEVLEEFPAPRGADWHAFDSATERKLATKDDSAMGDATRHLLAELNSAAFIDFLQRLTGIDGLVPDPHFVGGGLHQIEPGGHLKVHADFNRHPDTGLERRLNVLVYLNRDWKDEYGGAIELWSRDMRSAEAKILPVFNRVVVFSTTSTSYHGHPEPLNCPEDRTRKSMALYYYTKTRPIEEQGAEHNTLFQARPGEELPDGAMTARERRNQQLKQTARRLTPPILLDLARNARRGRTGRE